MVFWDSMGSRRPSYSDWRTGIFKFILRTDKEGERAWIMEKLDPGPGSVALVQNRCSEWGTHSDGNAEILLRTPPAEEAGRTETWHCVTRWRFCWLISRMARVSLLRTPPSNDRWGRKEDGTRDMVGQSRDVVGR